MRKVAIAGADAASPVKNGSVAPNAASIHFEWLIGPTLTARTQAAKKAGKGQIGGSWQQSVKRSGGKQKLCPRDKHLSEGKR